VAELRDFLSRFRPAGAPGAARVGVPADRSRELEAELGPVLALLAGTDAECRRIITRARRDAEQITAEARAEAAAIAAASEKACDEAMLEKARLSMEAGATGFIFGRNVFQRGHDESLRLVTELKQILAKYRRKARRVELSWACG
jgi:hypothetical protein